jgi:hypothetical protein
MDVGEFAPDSVGDDWSISAAAALDDPTRRAMYDFIRRARRPITREEAAAHTDISRKLAAFHLDKMVALGFGLPPRSCGAVQARWGERRGLRARGSHDQGRHPGA